MYFLLTCVRAIDATIKRSTAFTVRNEFRYSDPKILVQPRIGLTKYISAISC